MNGRAARVLLLAAVGALAFAMWRADGAPPAPVAASSPAPPATTTTPPATIRVVDPSGRTDVPDAAPAERSATAGAPAATPPGPDDVTLPTIGGAPADGARQRTLRMLTHAMANADRPCTMPADLDERSWARLDAWLSPLQGDRAIAADRSTKLLNAAVAERLQRGLYEVRDTPPDWSGTNGYVSVRDATDARGNRVHHVVRIAPGELPELDALRNRCESIDQDIGVLARDLFDRLAR